MFLILPGALFSQGIRDSVFRINEVRVQADERFKKEQAGVKSSGVDSLVLSEKINLSLSELLSENTSVFIKNHGRGALATASFRGTSASHTQVTWNGININAPMTGMTDFSLIPVYIIDDVYLKHGTGSITEMNGGLGGSVNLSNKVQWKPGWQVKYLQGLGSFRTFDEFLQIGAGNQKFQSKTRVYHNYSRNNFTFVNRGIIHFNPEKEILEHPLDTNDYADYKKYGLLQEFYYRFNAKNILAFRYWGQHADRTIPKATSYEGPDHSNLNSQGNLDHKAVMEWKSYGINSTLEAVSGISLKDLDYQLVNRITGLGEVPAVHSTSTQRSLLNHITYTYKLRKKLTIKARVDMNIHSVASKDAVAVIGYEGQRQELLSMVSVQRNFADRLNLNFVLRKDMVDGKLLPIVPFAGFDFKVIRGQKWHIKGNVARNYHLPSLNDMYWQPGGNPNLMPEEGFSSELGTEYRMDLDQLMIESEITFFRSDIDNWIIWIPSYKGYWEPRNVKNVLSKGIELSGGMKVEKGAFRYSVSGTYTFTRSLNFGDQDIWGDESYGKQLVYVPVHSGNVYFNLEHRGYTFSWQYNAFSERFTTSSNDVTRRDWLYPYFMNDLSMGKELPMEEFTLSAQFRIYNLFNETYHSVLYRPMPGRNFMLVLMFRM